MGGEGGYYQLQARPQCTVEVKFERVVAGSADADLQQAALWPAHHFHWGHPAHRLWSAHARCGFIPLRAVLWFNSERCTEKWYSGIVMYSDEEKYEWVCPSHNTERLVQFCIIFWIEWVCIQVSMVALLSLSRLAAAVGSARAISVSCSSLSKIMKRHFKFNKARGQWTWCMRVLTDECEFCQPVGDDIFG